MALTAATEDMPVRPFVLLAGSRLRAIRVRLSTLLEGWCADWGLDPAMFVVDCQRAWEMPALANWAWQSGYGGGTMAWQAHPAGFERQVLDGMFAPDKTDLRPPAIGIAVAAAQQATQDLAVRVAQRMLPGPEMAGAPLQPAARCFDYASGAIVMTVVICGQSMTWLCPHACLSAAEGEPGQVGVAEANLPPLSRRQHASGNVALRLTVEAGQADLSVGNLLTLAVGDVIRLNRSIDAPLAVCGPGGQRLFDGHLGKAGDVMALEVARHQ
jgi:flagellar motor switch/type III secretory pathway protein FliN